MNTNWWLWIALIAFLVFCCLPMFMSRRHKRPHDAAKEDAAKQQDRNSSK